MWAGIGIAVISALMMYLVLPESARPFSRKKKPSDLPVDVPPADDREWLTEALADLVKKRSTEPLLQGALVLPDPTYFPDPWTPTPAGAEAMLRRLMKFAQLDFLEVRLVTDEAYVPSGLVSEDRGERHVMAWFSGIQGDVAYFGIGEEQLKDPAVVAGALSHEVAHAYRRFHRLEAKDHDLEELLTDATTFFLGFGVLTTNVAYRYRVTNEVGQSVSSWSSGGYLPAQAMAYLLGLVIRARGLDARQLDAVSKHLEDLQKRYLKQSLEVIDAQPDSIEDVLHLRGPEKPSLKLVN